MREYSAQNDGKNDGGAGGPEAPKTMVAPTRPMGLLDGSDRRHLEAIDALLMAEHRVGPMTIRKARDFLNHLERRASKDKAAPPLAGPVEKLIATRVIALSMKTGMGREQAWDVFNKIAERARVAAAA